MNVEDECERDADSGPTDPISSIQSHPVSAEAEDVTCPAEAPSCHQFNENCTNDSNVEHGPMANQECGSGGINDPSAQGQSQRHSQQQDGLLSDDHPPQSCDEPVVGFESSTPLVTAKQTDPTTEAKPNLGDNVNKLAEPALTSEEIIRAHVNPHLVTFCEVPGRLSLLGTHRKTIVTLAEIMRRISPPESLNQSLMSAMLRKAKNRDGGEQVTKRLRDFGLSLPQGRRKPLSNTLFTSLCEGEAVQLGRDFSRLSQYHFPTQSIIYETLSNVKSVKDMSSYQAAYKTTYNVVNDIIKILSKDRAPVCDMPPGIKSDLHPDSQEEFIQFSLLTHGFGTPAHLAGLTTFTTGLQEAHRALSAPSEFCKAIQRPVPTAVKSALLDHFVTSNQGHG